MRISKYLALSPVFELNAAFELILGRVNRELKEDGLTFLQGLVLTALFFEQSDAVRPSELSRILSTSRSNMSHILSALEDKGWIKRNLNRQDAREFFISLKPEGKKKATTLIKYFNSLQEKFEAKLGEAQTRRGVLQIKKFRDSFSEDCADPAFASK
jgi:DNA-binding MarR family transcriptional regulator